MLFFLIYIKNLNNKLYRDIENQTLTLQELSEAFADLMPSTHDYYDINPIYVQALLLVFYNNTFDYDRREKLLIHDDDGKRITPITSKLDSGEKHSKLLRCIEEINNSRYYDNRPLTFLLNKINLTETLKV